MSVYTPKFVQDGRKAEAAYAESTKRSHFHRMARIAAVIGGTSGAESVHSLASFIAAQLRGLARETSRALLLLPPSLVRSGALRSDIYTGPTPTRLAPNAGGAQ
jgi:hypothetical protein